MLKAGCKLKRVACCPLLPLALALALLELFELLRLGQGLGRRLVDVEGTIRARALEERGGAASPESHFRVTAIAVRLRAGADVEPPREALHAGAVQEPVLDEARGFRGAAANPCSLSALLLLLLLL